MWLIERKEIRSSALLFSFCQTEKAARLHDHEGKQEGKEVR